MKTSESVERPRAHSALSLTPNDVRNLLKSHELTVSIIGLGRIGLPTAALFAHAGARVTGLDIDPGVVEQTNAGECRLLDEPGLEEMVRKSVAEKRLDATTKPEVAIPSSDFIVVCVPTPVEETKSPNYEAVRAASHAVGKSLSRGSIVILESTVGPGVVEDVVGPIIEKESGMKAGRDFGLASCPERSDPGSIVKNMHSVPRIIGCSDPRCGDLVEALYEEGLGVSVVRVRDAKTANAVKLTENLFRDVNIALANEFALLFENFGIDTIEVINACATKYNFIPHYPGTGVGGPCVGGDEFVFLVDKEGLHAVKIADYVSEAIRSERVETDIIGTTKILRPKEDLLTLSFDGRRSLFEKVLWFSARPYLGKAIRLGLSTNRHVTVTQDHPMLVKTARGFSVRRANEIQTGDEIPLSVSYSPAFFTEDSLDLIAELAKSKEIPLTEIKVKPRRYRFKDSGSIKRTLKTLGVPSSRVREYLRWNYMPLETFIRLEKAGEASTDRRDLAIYTSRGSTTRVPASLKMDENFWRFVGYYSSEGCAYREKSLRGERDRIKISFGAHEGALIEDCKSILSQWGITPDEEVANGSHSLRFSSRIFGFLIHCALDAGTNSYNKRVPPQLFFSSRRNIASYLQGLFRGDGWIESSRRNGNENVSLGFATVSTELFQGTLLLLQAFGITPTCREIRGRKSTIPAQALRISRYQDLMVVQEDIGGLPKLQATLQSYYHTTKKSPVLADYRAFKTAFVEDIDESDYDGEVYNMEVERTHVFVTSFGIMTHNCLPSNPYYLISEGLKVGNIPYLIRLAREINDRMPEHVVELAAEALNEVRKTIGGSKIAVLGIAYKPGVRDIQLSPVEPVVRRFMKMGATVELFDPMFKGEEAMGAKVRTSAEEAVKGADCIVVGTAHEEFKKLDLSALAKIANPRAALVDGRNVFDPQRAKKAGFAFRGVGRAA